MAITLDIRLLGLPVRRTLAAAHGVGSDAPIRNLTVVNVTDDTGRSGWGECSALNQVGYSSESATTAFELLSTDARIADPAALTALLAEAPMAMAALEMAEYDLRLQSAGVPLSEFLGVDSLPVTAGAAIGLGAVAASVATARQLHEAGFTRVKLKIIPAAGAGFAPAETVAAIGSEFPELEIHVDGNGSFDRGSLAEIEAVAAAGAAFVEQPFAPRDVAPAAALVRAGMSVLADEAATDLATVEQLVAMGACSGVVVKSSRLGGLYSAMELLTWCAENDVPAAAGGMQESGLGRAALAVMAGHSACTVTGDVSPARRWLAEDPWPDLVMTDGMIQIPSGPGVASAPDLELLDRLTLKAQTRTVVFEQNETGETMGRSQ